MISYWWITLVPVNSFTSMPKQVTVIKNPVVHKVKTMKKKERKKKRVHQVGDLVGGRRAVARVKGQVWPECIFYMYEIIKEKYQQGKEWRPESWFSRRRLLLPGWNMAGTQCKNLEAGMKLGLQYDSPYWWSPHSLLRLLSYCAQTTSTRVGPPTSIRNMNRRPV